MTKATFQPLKRLIFQILLLISCYFISRSVFTLVNLDRFHGLGLPGFLRLAFHGLRYDISAIVTINAVYIILYLLPWPITKPAGWDRFLQWLFIITNSIAFIFEISDWAYFPFSLKRSTVDIFDMITRKGDFMNLLPHFLLDFWYVPLCLVKRTAALGSAAGRLSRRERTNFDASRVEERIR
ncbi:MAG: hypothetical protein EOP49_43210, partial [Sphingobacteriales bacterium]